MQRTTLKVILDKSFLQAENRECRRLCALRDAGYGFVLIDTLAYELCTDANQNQLPAALHKLQRFYNCIGLWRHTADLLKQEIVTQKPVSSPIDHDLTAQFSNFLKQGEFIQSSNRKASIEQSTKQRETDSVTALISCCRSLSEQIPEYTAFILKGGPSADAALEDMATRSDAVNHIIKRNHGNKEALDIYIEGAENAMLGPEWFAYHNAKAIHALWCIFMKKYGLSNKPGLNFTHTKLDADYLVLLNYADALATNETSGDMSCMIRWLYGDTKKIFSTRSIDQEGVSN